ncbi:uncharacterized protein ISCGN_011565 [Ixodes scapularis]
MAEPHERRQKEQQIKAAINQKLVESGERDRLKELLRTRLIECGWKDQLKAHCKEIIKDKGVENLTVDDLIAAVTPQGRAEIECPGSASFSLGVEDCSGFPWSEKDTWVATDTLDGSGPLLDTASAKDPLWKAERRRFASWTPVYEKQGPKWCIASPGGPRRVQTYPGLGSTTRMPFSPDTGKPRTAIRGRANPHGSGSVETPLSKHLLSQAKCGSCGAGTLTLSKATDKEYGLAVKLLLVCATCKFEKKQFSSPRVAGTAKITPFEVNIKAMKGIQSIGKGVTALADFCVYMNLSHRGLPHKTFQGHLKTLVQACEKSASASEAASLEVVKRLYADF